MCCIVQGRIVPSLFRILNLAFRNRKEWKENSHRQHRLVCCQVKFGSARRQRARQDLMAHGWPRPFAAAHVIDDWSAASVCSSTLLACTDCQFTADDDEGGDEGDKERKDPRNSRSPELSPCLNFPLHFVSIPGPTHMGTTDRPADLVTVRRYSCPSALSRSHEFIYCILEERSWNSLFYSMFLDVFSHTHLLSSRLDC